MKRFALYVGIVATMASSCSIRDDIPVAPQMFYASIEQSAIDTKVYSNEARHLCWTADDRVSLFNNSTYNQQYRFTGETGDSAGGFTEVDTDEFVTGREIPHVVSVYPYRSSTRISENETLTITLPSEQYYAENTFGLGANTMVSVSSDDYLQYKNVSGYLRISLFGEGISVSSIKLEGNTGEKLAGKTTVTMPLEGVPSVRMADGGAMDLTLVCEKPVTLGATADKSTAFWFVVPPCVFSNGFTVTIFHSGEEVKISTFNTITIERNRLTKMSPIGI